MRTIGIDSGDHSVKVVELDGNYRKLRLLRAHCEFVSDPALRAEMVADATRAALDSGMRGEVCLGQPCREAVLRVIELPFKGHDAIRKVVKAEVEGEIHSHVVDDMVVDFYELGPGNDGGTRVLVASLPKAGLRAHLQALKAESIEPETVDLDTMALFRAAHWAGAFSPEEGAEPAPAGALTAVIDLGARSVKVILVEGEQLLEMRALRLGDASIVDEIVRHHGLPFAVAREAVARCLTTGSDHQVEVDEALPATAGDEAPPTPKRRSVTVSNKEVEAARSAFMQRLSRELVRYLASTGKAARVRALWMTGGALRLQGMSEVLREAFSIEPRELALLDHLQHDLDEETVANLGPSLACAIGLALGKIGGPTGFNLRQEDLAFTRGFERIKFPLAIACMVGLLALFTVGGKRSTELRNLELQIGRTFQKDAKSPVQFHGMLNTILGQRWFETPQRFRYEQSKGKDYGYKELIADLVEEPVHGRIALVRNKLKAVADYKQKESGIYEDVSLESGFAVLVRFAQIMKAIEPQLGRYLLLKLHLNMKTSRSLEFVVAFSGENFREPYGVLTQALEAEYEKRDSPFEKGKTNENRATETPFKIDPARPGAYWTFKLRVKDSFETFGPSAPVTLGMVDRATTSKPVEEPPVPQAPNEPAESTPAGAQPESRATNDGQGGKR